MCMWRTLKWARVLLCASTGMIYLAIRSLAGNGNCFSVVPAKVDDLSSFCYFEPWPVGKTNGILVVLCVVTHPTDRKIQKVT